MHRRSIKWSKTVVMTRRPIKWRVRESTELARKAFALHEAGHRISAIALMLSVSEGNAANLVGFGRRIAARPGEPVAD